jgi:hypothetical protein
MSFVRVPPYALRKFRFSLFTFRFSLPQAHFPQIPQHFAEKSEGEFDLLDIAACRTDDFILKRPE